MSTNRTDTRASVSHASSHRPSEHADRIEADYQYDGYVPVVHMCPPGDSGEMPCCGLQPFERMRDQMTLDPALVTCGGSS